MGSTATGTQPANPSTTLRSAPELLLEWQEGMYHLLDLEEGGGSAGPPHLEDLLGGSRPVCSQLRQASVGVQWGCRGGRGPEPDSYHPTCPSSLEGV